jgi:hypothetical protein
MRLKTKTICFAAFLAVALAGSVAWAPSGKGVGWNGTELNAHRSWPKAASALSGQMGDPGYDPNARTTEGLDPGRQTEMVPAAPGDILKSWTPTGLGLAWGVGFDGDVWLSDVPSNDDNTEFTVDGLPTGLNWPAPWAGEWPADMAFDAGRGWMCQVNVGGDNGIYCWDPGSGAVVASITGVFPWTSISQRGLAYRPDDDTFYIGGWVQEILYHVKGFSWATPGEVLGQCSPPDGTISGLAWNPTAGIIWEATNSATDTLYQLNPSTCAVLGTLAHPDPGYDGGGLAMDAAGNLWMVDQDPNTVYLVESGVLQFDLKWHVMAGGGAGSPLTGSGFSVYSTLGQTGIGPAGGGASRLCAGFWCGVRGEGVHIYLPLVVREF